MLAGIVGAICLVAVIVMLRIVRARRARIVDKAMRDYVRRAY